MVFPWFSHLFPIQRNATPAGAEEGPQLGRGPGHIGGTAVEAQAVGRCAFQIAQLRLEPWQWKNEEKWPIEID